MKQLEQLVTVAIQERGPLTELALMQLLSTEAGIGDTLHALKIRGQLARSDMGLWSIKTNAADSPPVIQQRDMPMTDTAAPAATKKCPRCKKTKPIESAEGKPNFYGNGYCRPCGLEDSRARSAKKKKANGHAPAPKKIASKRVAKYQHGVVPDALDRMVINLFSIRIKDHAGAEHDLVLSYDTVKQLLTELQDCTR